MDVRRVGFRWPSVSAELLRDDAQLHALVLELVGAGRAPRAAVTWFRCWAAAEHALAIGLQPGALFRWLVDGQRWELLTESDDARGASRLRAWRGRCGAPGRPAMADPVRLAECGLAALLERRGPPASRSVAGIPTLSLR